MSRLFAISLAAMVGTVDRIEGPMAVVDWGVGDPTDLPLALLEPGVSEGDRVRVHLRTSSRGTALALAGSTPCLSTAQGLVTLGPNSSLKPGRTYDLAVHTQPAHRAWRTRP